MSSVAFVQVHSPFVWGRVNVGGLTVQLWLKNQYGEVIAGATQVTQGTAAGQRCSDNPEDKIKIDPGQLYFETVFRACDSNDPIMIRPGYTVQVKTSGYNPSTPELFEVQDKEILIDAIESWTSYEQDTVSGIVPPNASVVVTVASFSLDLGGGYITPGSSVTYAELTADGSGNFTASNFRTSADGTYKTVDMVQGTRGFVRVIHGTGDEVYSVHGQNALVLENSSIVHGYAYPLPTAPSGLIYTNPPITVPRPPTTVAVTVKAPGGAVKGTGSATVAIVPYTAVVNTDIVGGDTVEVSINGAPPNQMVTVPITASIDVGNNQIQGNAKPSTGVIVGVGRVTGYVTKNTTFTYVQHRVDTNASGAYQTDQIQCGSSNYLNLGPGSFGYVGYEDPRGNFIYMAFAAQANYAMIDYPLVEGWVADGLVRPTITIRDSSNQIKHQAVETPMVIYLQNQKLYLNTYYVHFTTAYITAGDQVQVNTGTSVNIPVPSQGLTAFLNDESDVVSGKGLPGASLRVIPAGDKSSRKDTVVASNGRFAAENPYTSVNLSNCGETSKTQDFKQGDSGRVYLRYADGNEVFAFYGRAMSVNQNENRVELWIIPLRGIDWTTTPNRNVDVTLTPKSGTPVTVSKVISSYDRLVEIKDAGGNKVLIRAGDSLLVTFNEGPDGLTRQVDMSFNSIPLLTGSPDVESSTLAGVGPTADWLQGGWLGGAWTVSPVKSKVSRIPARNVTAYAPVSFETSAYNPAPIKLVQGYAGQVGFSDDYGRRVWIAWAATSIQVKITGWPRIGDTVVCGKAPPNSTVNIYDVTDPVNRKLIGSGTSNAEGQFCVTVAPPLYKDQVIIAESLGVYSQPYVVREIFQVLLPLVRR